MKWSVGMKIISINIVAIVALMGLGYLNYYSTHHMLKALSWQQHSLHIKENIEEILLLLVDSETGQRGYLLSGQADFLEPYRNSMANVPKKLAFLKTLIANDIQGGGEDQQKKLDELTQAIAKKNAFMQQTFVVKERDKLIAILENGKKAMDDIRHIVNTMLVKENTILAGRIANTEKSVTQTTSVIVYGTLFIAILIITLTLILSRNIAKPLKEITDISQKIALGDLTTDFKVLRRRDEVGLLSQAFAKMTNTLQNVTRVAAAIAKGDLTVHFKPQGENDNLGNAINTMLHNTRKFVYENNETIQFVNGAVSEILTSISQLVSTGSETATAVSETTSTIEEVRQTSQLACEKAKSVADNAQFAADISQSGSKAIQDTNEGMKRIRDQMTSIAQSMMQLSDQTQGISGIVETVDDLAQQSNLLSVNASIEAEKAGDQGKGFRIVAQEIKSLADQSKQATHRVREILTDVQKATSAAVLATEQGNKAVEGGAKKSEESGEAIIKLSNTITDSAQAAMQIAASNQQQLVGMEQAAMAMENIKQASIQGVDSAKQLEVAADNLKKIILKLQHSIEAYHVDFRGEERAFSHQDIVKDVIQKAKSTSVE